MKLPQYQDFSRLSFTVRFLSASDATLTAALGLFGPIFAVYLTQQISTDNALEVIGIGTSIYLFTRSMGQMPLAFLIDRIPGERDDFWILMAGMVVFIIVPILYLFISEPWHLFAIQFIYGAGAALTYPTWLAIFTRHIDKGKEATEWGMYQTMVDLSGAVAAPIGGFVAALYGFEVVFIFASIMAFASSLFIFAIRHDLRNT